MMIRPVTDLRNHYPDVEADLKKAGAIYLTKNGYGAAVLISIEEYAELTGKRDIPQAQKKDKPSNGRGFLKQYADPSKTPLEKEAGRLHAIKKYKEMIPEVTADE